MAKHAAVYCQSGVQRIQAGGDLHPLSLIDGVAVSEINPGLFESLAAVGEAVLKPLALRESGFSMGWTSTPQNEMWMLKLLKIYTTD